jgi:predicted restriction endonuclease
MLDEFMEDCKALPQWFCFDKMIDTDYEIVISEMVNEFENKKHLDRLLKKNVIATKPDGKEYVWKITPHWTREKLTAMVREKGYTNIQGAA